jgi:prevent-host-death family protein
MGDTIVGVAKAKNEFSEIINRAAYGGERIVIGSRGKPKAAVISIADLQKLEAFEQKQAQTQADQYAVLARAAALREEISRRRGGEPLPDSVELLRQMRLERSR